MRIKKFTGIWSTYRAGSVLGIVCLQTLASFGILIIIGICAVHRTLQWAIIGIGWRRWWRSGYITSTHNSRCATVGLRWTRGSRLSTSRCTCRPACTTSGAWRSAPLRAHRQSRMRETAHTRRVLFYYDDSYDSNALYWTSVLAQTTNMANRIVSCWSKKEIDGNIYARLTVIHHWINQCCKLQSQ